MGEGRGIERPGTLWRLDSLGLMEMTPEMRRFYHFWGPGFRCLRLSQGCWQSEIPERIFLDQRGVWLEPDGPRTDGWHASRSALAFYFGMIPTGIRRSAAMQRHGQWQALLRLCHEEMRQRR